MGRVGGTTDAGVQDEANAGTECLERDDANYINRGRHEWAEACRGRGRAGGREGKSVRLGRENGYAEVVPVGKRR